MITFDEYQRLTQQNWNKMGRRKNQQRHEFQSAQPKTCPKCGVQVFDPFGWGVVMHDVTHKTKTVAAMPNSVSATASRISK
jgi:hypothetical protein